MGCQISDLDVCERHTRTCAKQERVVQFPGTPKMHQRILGLGRRVAYGKPVLSRREGGKKRANADKWGAPRIDGGNTARNAQGKE